MSSKHYNYTSLLTIYVYSCNSVTHPCSVTEVFINVGPINSYIFTYYYELKYFDM